MKYRKKPVVVDAEQNTEENLINVLSLANSDQCRVFVNQDSTLTICTLEGDMIASVGDWVIKGVQGEIYPCKPDIFIETYEKVEE